MLSKKQFIPPFLLMLMVSSVLTVDIDISEHWKNFKAKFSKSYEAGEEAIRAAIFANNVRFIVKHNLEADVGLHSYRLGINHFVDLAHEEFKEKYTIADTAEEIDLPTSTFDSCANSEDVEDEIDLREAGMVSEVRDQDICGSGYAFASAGSLEGVWKKKTGQMAPLSAQSIVDCSTDTGNRGCGGGSVKNAFVSMLKKGGVPTEKQYPYERKSNECRFQAGRIGAVLTGFETVKTNSETDLKKAVASVGPIACGVNGSPKSFVFYKSGIYDDPACTANSNHAVTVVGYGAENDLDFWLLKNSWGKEWGEEGYMKLARNKDNRCGIASNALFPTV